MPDIYKSGDVCPMCEEGVLKEVDEYPDYLYPPVFECSDCGDLIGSPYGEDDDV